MDWVQIAVSILSGLAVCIPAIDGRLLHFDKKEADQFLLGCLRHIRREPYKRSTSRKIYATSGIMSSGSSQKRAKRFSEGAVKKKRPLHVHTRKHRKSKESRLPSSACPIEHVKTSEIFTKTS